MRERRGAEDREGYLKTPLVLMWAMREALSMQELAPIVTRSGSVIIGSPPLG
jgi:hypothetical protein